MLASPLLSSHADGTALAPWLPVLRASLVQPSPSSSCHSPVATHAGPMHRSYISPLLGASETIAAPAHRPMVLLEMYLYDYNEEKVGVESSLWEVLLFGFPSTHC